MNNNNQTQALSVETRVEKRSETDFYVYVKNLPAFGELKAKVDILVKNSTWFDKFGIEWIFIFSAMIVTAIGYLLASHNSWNVIILANLLVGLAFSTLVNKSGHIGTHGGLCNSSTMNKFWTWLFGEFYGLISVSFGYDVHIKGHHSHTNIIGLGDSSIWRAGASVIPSYVHMFILPLLLPFLGPFVSMAHLLPKPLLLIRYIASASVGYFLAISPLVLWCGYSHLTAFLFLYSSRCILAVSFFHVNIFQHIGLPMYDKQSRPARLYQMSSGVLNLDRISVLDYAFGHSLINCHVEHHLFPMLSDNMCLKIKPLVKLFLVDHALPYHEDSYQNRLKYFLENYKELMAKAPPITHFVGFQ